MYARFPRGRYAERAAWKAGWTSYRKGDMSEAAPLLRDRRRKLSAIRLSSGVAVLVGPRARSAWAIVPGAIARYQLTIADYHNTYYGRLAQKLLEKQGAPLGTSHLVFAPASVAARPGRTIIPADRRHDSACCSRSGLYEPAVKELEFARAKWGDSPGITATLAWANKQMAAIGVGHAANSRSRAARLR